MTKLMERAWKASEKQMVKGERNVHKSLMRTCRKMFGAYPDEVARVSDEDKRMLMLAMRSGYFRYVRYEDVKLICENSHVVEPWYLWKVIRHDQKLSRGGMVTCLADLAK